MLHSLVVRKTRRQDLGDSVVAKKIGDEKHTHKGMLKGREQWRRGAKRVERGGREQGGKMSCSSFFFNFFLFLL